MACTNLSSKRKASTSFIPESISSYVMGALRDNFDHLKNHILHDCAFVASKNNPNQFAKQVLEELFRYLYLLADSSSGGVIRSSPSVFVDQAFLCLMLNPLLYWKVCDEILNMQGKDTNEVKVRLLPHDALGGTGDDEDPRRARYTNTLAQYKTTFGEDPPLAIWSDYSNDPVAVQAELQAQEAQCALVRDLHSHSRSPTAVTAFAFCMRDRKFTVALKYHSSEQPYRYEITRRTLMSEVMQTFAAQINEPLYKLRFFFDCDRLKFEDTVQSLNLKGGDVISVMKGFYRET